MQPAVQPGKTFLLVIGCQKGGTAWIYDYLAKHPQSAVDKTKEYHVLDAHFDPAFRGYHDRIIDQRRAHIARLSRAAPAGKARLDPAAKARLVADLGADIERRLHLKTLAADLGNYVAHFEALHRQGGRLVCDVTPSYCFLKAGDWAQVRTLLKGAGFDVRVAFILRDPVDRSHSAFAMSRRRRFQNEAFAGGRLSRARLHFRRAALDAAARLRRLLARSNAARADNSPFLRYALEATNLHRSSYEKTIAEIEQVFPRQDVHYALFETFFNDAALGRFTEFAGIDFVPGAYGNKKRAKVPKTAPVLSEFEIAHLRRTLAPTYDFAATRFGHDLIRANWRYY